MNEKELNSLKAAREHAGLTQKEVEDHLGMRSLTMRDYEVGRLKLPVHVALKLARLYRISLDELVGNEDCSNKTKSKVLSRFSSLFSGNGFSIMFLDPIMRGYLEGHHDKYFENSLYDLLTFDMGKSLKTNTVVEISKILFSLASCDGKVSDEEIDCIRDLLRGFGLKNKFKEISVINSKAYSFQDLPTSFERIEIRHFTVWMLFFFAEADGEITHHEVEFIENCAEKLFVNKSNYLFIKGKFVKESV